MIVDEKALPSDEQLPQLGRDLKKELQQRQCYAEIPPILQQLINGFAEMALPEETGKKGKGKGKTKGNSGKDDKQAGEKKVKEAKDDKQAEEKKGKKEKEASTIQRKRRGKPGADEADEPAAADKPGKPNKLIMY